MFTLIHSVFPESECEHTNRLFISVQFRSFLLSSKTGKTFMWISPKVHRFWNWNYSLRLQLVSYDIQVYQCIFRGLRIVQIPWKNVQHSESGWYAHDLSYMFKVTSSSPPLSLINFFQKMTTRGEISLRYIAHKITFFQSRACFICLKHLLLRTLDVNIAKLCNIWFWAFFANCPYKK